MKPFTPIAGSEVDPAASDSQRFNFSEVRSMSTSQNASRRLWSHRSLLRVCAFAAVAGAGGALAHGATYTYKFPGGTSGWDNSTVWLVGGNPAASYPQLAGDVADLNINYTSNLTVSVNVPVTIGQLKIGDPDGSNYAVVNTGTAGVLKFDNVAGNAQIVHASSRDASNTDVISVPVQLLGNLDLINNSPAPTGTNAYFQIRTGGISSGAASGTQFLTSTVGTTYLGSAAVLSDGGSGGKLGLRVNGGSLIVATAASQNNTFSGGVSIEDGTLRLDLANNATPLGANVVQLGKTGASTSATLAVRNGSVANNIQVNHVVGGVLSLAAPSVGTQATLTGTVTLANDLSIWTSDSSGTGVNGKLNLNGKLTGTGNLTVSASNADSTNSLANAVLFGGTVANDYVGTLALTAGQLQLNKSNNVTAVTGDVSISASGVLKWNFSEQIKDMAGIDVASGGYLWLNGKTETLRSLKLGTYSLPAGTYAESDLRAGSHGGYFFGTGSGTLIIVVPEPSSLSLLALGGLAMLRRSRRSV